MTARKTATTSTTTAPRKRVSRSKAPVGVSLDRVTPKLSSGLTTDYSGFVRALWNMGDAADSATTLDKEGNTVPSESARRYYGARRDALLNTFVQYL